MRLSLGHKLSAVFVGAVAIFMATALASFRETRELQRTTALVTHSQRVLAELDGLVGTMLDAESAVRAFAADGQPAARARFDAASRMSRVRLAGISTLVRDDSALRREAGDVERAVDHQLGTLDGVIAARVRGDIDAASAMLRAIDHAVDSASVPFVSRRVLAHERAMLLARTRDAAQVAERANEVLQGGLALALVLAPLGILVVRSDTRTRHDAERALRESEARFRAAADGSLDAFYVLRAVRDAAAEVVDFTFVDLNARAESLLGLPREVVVGQRLCELVPMNRAGGFFEKYRRVMETGTVLEEEFEVTSPQVNAAWIRHQVVPLADGVAITSRDVTERRRQDEAMRALSLVDELTGLYNRRGFLTLAQQQLKLARRGHRELLLLFIDMDDFKEINDTFGHAEGDTALRRTAELLRRTFRDSDIIGRLGGDEFVVLATDSGATMTEAIVQRLRRELRERNDHDGYPYRLSFSVGVARFDHDAPPTLEELIAAADGMLYEQKRHRRLTTPT